MHFFSVVLFLCYFAFLFCLHFTAKDDFLFLRKNITLEKLFSVGTILGIIALFFSRLFYVFFHFNKHFFNPLVFFLFPYFPGLSLAGGFLGGILMLFYVIKRRKMPAGKVLDIYLLSFLATLPVGFSGLSLLEGKNNMQPIHVILAILYLCIFFVIMKFFFPKVTAGKIKDGTISAFIITGFCFISMAQNMLYKKPLSSVVVSGEFLIFFILFLLTLIFSFLKKARAK